MLLARNLHSFVQTLQAKNQLSNEIDIKCITWGVTNSRTLDGKADGCSPWFLSRLALEKSTARRVNKSRLFQMKASQCLLIYILQPLLDVERVRLT